MNALETTNLSKSIGAQSVLRQLSWSVPQGSICGLLGRNGAGKSTLLKTCLGMWRADAGTVRLLGQPQDPEGLGDLPVAYVAETPLIPGWMKVKDAVDLEARFRPGLDRTLLRQWESGARQRLNSLSKGQRRKLELDLALAWPSKLLLLDEPFDGLDPVARAESLQALVQHAADHQATVVLSSHAFADFERLCDRIGVLAQGRIVFDSEMDALRGDVRLAVGNLSALNGLSSKLDVVAKRRDRQGDALLLRNITAETERQLQQKGFTLVPASVEQLGIELLRCMDEKGVQHE